MKLKLVARYLADGSVRAVWSDAFQSGQHGRPLRASRIEVVESGRFAGQFYTTIVLGERLCRPELEVSLWPPLPSYAASVAREVQWLESNFVLEAS